MSDFTIEVIKYAFFLILGIIIGRYLPRILDIFDRKMINVGKRLIKWREIYKKENELVANYRNLIDEQGNVHLENLEYLESHFSDEIIDFAVKNEVPSLLIRCLSDSDNNVQVKCLSILNIIGRQRNPKILVDSGIIPALIPLLGSQDPKIKTESISLLIYIGENGFSKDVVNSMTGEEEPRIAYELFKIYQRFLEHRPLDEFLDNTTIKSYLKYLALLKDPYNAIAVLLRGVNEGKITFAQIVEAGKIDLFKRYLTTSGWDTKAIVCAMFREFTKRGESHLIIDNGFLPIFIQLKDDENPEVRGYAEKVVSSLQNPS